MKINPADYKILIVDDVMSNVLLLKVLLVNEKFQIVTASNGKQALDQVIKEKPDLVLLDVMMPDMTGFEVAETMKADRRMADIPVIFLTALNSTGDIVKGFKAGGNDFISKPFNKEELIIRVKHQLSLVQAKRIIENKNRELQTTMAGRDKMYSVIAHDLRSPMGSIKMVLNMLMLNLKPEVIGEEMHELLNVANQTTEETFSLLDNLLKWTKSLTGGMQTVLQRFDFSEMVEAVVDVNKIIADLKNIKIRTELTPQLMVNADIDMMKTAVRNIISNAIKFSHPGKEIVITARAEQNKMWFGVQDFGTGMDEECQQKLLDTRTHFSTFGTNNEEGSGLGLLLTKDFVNRNGGELRFVSKKGVGSTFFFTLPMDV